MKKSDLLLAILMCISWSSDYIITKKALEFFSPMFFSSIRFIIVGLIIAPTLRRIPPRLPILIFISFPLVVLVYGFIDIAIQMNSSVTVTSIITKFEIMTSIIAAYIFLGEKLSKRQIFGIALAFAGVFIVIIGNGFENIDQLITKLFRSNDSKNFEIYFNNKNVKSLIFLIISCFAWPIYSIFSKKIAVNDGVKENEIIGWTAIFGGIFGIVISLIFEKNQIHSIQNASITHLSYIFYAGLIGVLLPHLILHYLIKIYGVCKASIFNLAIPFITAIGGILFFKEKINIFIIFGGILLILGVYIMQYSKSSNDACSIIDSNL